MPERPRSKQQRSPKKERICASAGCGSCSLRGPPASPETALLVARSVRLLLLCSYVPAAPACFRSFYLSYSYRALDRTGSGGGVGAARENDGRPIVASPGKSGSAEIVVSGDVQCITFLGLRKLRPFCLLDDLLLFALHLGLIRQKCIKPWS